MGRAATTLDALFADEDQETFPEHAQDISILTLRRRAMPRGDELHDQFQFSDREDDAEDLGYGGGASYDDDEEEDGGWMTHKDDSDDLWDSTEDVEEEEEEADLFGGEAVAAPVSKRTPIVPAPPAPGTAKNAPSQGKVAPVPKPAKPPAKKAAKVPVRKAAKKAAKNKPVKKPAKTAAKSKAAKKLTKKPATKAAKKRAQKPAKKKGGGKERRR